MAVHPGTAADTASAPAGAGGTGAPALLSSFQGIESFDNYPESTTPPDVQIAVGPEHIIEMVNVTGMVFGRDGETLDSFPLVDLFQVPEGWRDFDPKVIYDDASGRFFAVYTGYLDEDAGTDPARLFVAVSSASDPLDVWDIYSIGFEDVFPDYPGVGLTDDKITVAANMYDIDSEDVDPSCRDNFCGVQVIVMEKSELLAGADPLAIVVSDPDPDHDTIRPAHSLTPASTQHMASVDSVDLSTTAEELHLWEVTGTPAAGDVVITHGAHPAISPLTSPCIETELACAEHLGGDKLIDSGDNRLLEAVWREGTMWLSSIEACDWAGDPDTRSCLRLIEVDTDTSTVVQEITYGAAGMYYFYPAIRTDEDGNLVTVFSRSSASQYVEARVAARLAGDPPGTLSESGLLKEGETAYDPGDYGSEYRWGDYMGAAVDPVDPSVIWVAGQYARDDGWDLWGTYVGRVQVEEGPPPAASGDVDCSGAVNTRDSLGILRHSAALPPLSQEEPCTDVGVASETGVFGDVNCNGSVNSVDALMVMRHVAGLPVTLPPGCPPAGP